MLPTYQRISGSQPSNPLLPVRRSFRSSEKCLILLVLLTFGFVCFGGFFFLPDNFGTERVLKVYKHFQKAGPEIFIPPPPPAHGLLEGDEDPHKLNDREKLQEKIKKELPDDFLEKPDLDVARSDGPEFDNMLGAGAPAPAVMGPMAGGPAGVVAPPQIIDEPEVKAVPKESSPGSVGTNTFNSNVGEDSDPSVREKRNKVKEEAGEILNHLIRSCSKGFDVTEELVERYRRIDFPDDPVTRCVLRCMALTLGVYDDQSGIHMAQTWLMFRGDRTSAAEEKLFADQHYRCIESNLEAVPARDFCGRVYATYLCYREEFQALVQKIRKLSG